MLAFVLSLLREYALYIVPVLVAALANELAEVAQRWNRWLDDRGPKVKRLAVATLAFLGAKLSTALGVPISDLGEVAAAGLAYLFHLGDGHRAVKSATGAHLP